MVLVLVTSVGDRLDSKKYDHTTEECETELPVMGFA